MHTLRAVIAAVLSVTAVVFTLTHPSAAQSQECSADQFATLVDDTGAYLREFAVKRRPLLHDKFDQLARTRDWSVSDAEELGYRLVQDQRTTEYDTQARKLLIELDRIAAAAEANPACKELDRLKTVTLELRAITEAKFTYMLKRADLALGDNAKAAKPDETREAKAPRELDPQVQAPQELAPRIVAPPPEQVRPKPAPQAPAATQRPQPTPRPPETLPWQTTTETTPPAIALQALPPPEPADPSRTFSVSEIREAGRGLFGNISAELASIIQYTFENYGAPNGYIVGSEGGAAFLAGLNFGSGELQTKSGASLKVYWQGPTVGYDLGLQGSRVMILVYNLAQPENIFTRYGGIGGSAYIVGGVGLTYHMRGKVVLAPIRTGIGLRLGANIGYLKFTPRLSLNPF